MFGHFFSISKGRAMLSRAVKMVLFYCCTALAGSCASHDPAILSPVGFRDIAWGTAMSGVNNLKPLEKGGGRWTWAIREPEDFSVDGVDVDSITYIFIDEAFAGIDVKFVGAERFGQFMQHFKKTIGPPNVANKNMNMLAWTNNEATVMLRYYLKLNQGTLKYTFDSLTAQ